LIGWNLAGLRDACAADHRILPNLSGKPSLQHSSSSSSSSPQRLVRRPGLTEAAAASLLLSCFRFLATCPDPDGSKVASGTSDVAVGVAVGAESGWVRNVCAETVSSGFEKSGSFCGTSQPTTPHNDRSRTQKHEPKHGLPSNEPESSCLPVMLRSAVPWGTARTCDQGRSPYFAGNGSSPRSGLLAHARRWRDA
jgi:hypothetical protein